MNTDFPKMSVTHKIKQAIAYVKFAKEPVNSMDLKLWQDLDSTLTEISKDKSVRGIIFYSGLKREIFTAGNDLMELYAPKTSPERYEKFWSVSNKVLAQILGSPLVTLAAVNGSCPAGGCCLALACDFRLASEDVVLGLNETALGIAVPAVWGKLLAYTVGQGKADKMTMFAQLVPAKEALKIGLVDQIVKTRDELLPTAELIVNQVFSLIRCSRFQIWDEVLQRLKTEVNW